MKEISIKVPDASCKMCFKTIEKAILSVNGVQRVRVKPENQEFVVEGDAKPEELLAAIRAVGYHPEE